MLGCFRRFRPSIARPHPTPLLTLPLRLWPVCQPACSLALSSLRFCASVCRSFPSDRLSEAPAFDPGPAVLGTGGGDGGGGPLEAPPLTPPLFFAVHGQFSVAVRGCGSGLPGKNDRGLDLYGLLAFIQLQQCSQDRCNTKLNLTSRALNPAGRWGRGPRLGGGATPRLSH